MVDPILFGASYSVYVRIVRLALAEKRVPYRLLEIDIYAPGGPPADHAARHPFKRIPAFEHDGFALYETGAIARYVDEAFSGPSLMPKAVKSRARVNQAISIIDNYAYRSMVRGVYTECVEAPREGRRPDTVKLAASLALAETCLDALEHLAMPTGPALLGTEMTLADLYLAPMMRYFTMAGEGSALLSARPTLSEWWQFMQVRPSMAATRFPEE